MSSLYLDHFGLAKPPFQITPDLGFFFSGGRRGDILSALLHVAQHEEGIMTLVAEVGSGKTMLARLMLSRLPTSVCTIYLANPSFSRDEILGAIGRELGLTDLPSSTEARLAALQQELLRRHATGQRVLLVIDEAHAMPPESLEEVRLLSNLETEQHKLLNIILFGQPELDDTLADRRMRQVRDRVVHRFALSALPENEATAYIDHRLRAAGWQGSALFAPAAMALLIKASGGRARRINLLADKSLLAAYASGKLSVLIEHVRSAVSELHDDISAPRAWQWLDDWRTAGVALVGVALLGGLGVAGMQKFAKAPPPTTAVAVVPMPTPEPQRAAPAAVAPVAVAAVAAPQVIAVPVAAAPAQAAASAIAIPAPAWMAELEPFIQRTHAKTKGDWVPGFTVQIASLPREPTAAGYLNSLAQQIDKEQLYVQLSHYNGKEFIAVFIGSYPSSAQANAALLELPTSLKANKPLVRTWNKIRQDQLS